MTTLLMLWLTLLLRVSTALFRISLTIWALTMRAYWKVSGTYHFDGEDWGVRMVRSVARDASRLARDWEMISLWPSASSRKTKS